MVLHDKTSGDVAPPDLPRPASEEQVSLMMVAGASSAIIRAQSSSSSKKLHAEAEADIASVLILLHDLDLIPKIASRQARRTEDTVNPKRLLKLQRDKWLLNPF